MEFEKKVIVDVDGKIEKGKQFDLDLRLPEDDRNVVYGIVKDHHGDPISDAVIKLVEVSKDDRKPVSHTFTDKEGEFVFGPLCPFKSYAIEIWVNRVKHVKICKICEHEGNCLKGVDLYCDEPYKRMEPKMKYEEKEDYKDEYKKEYKEEYKDDYKEDYKKEHKEDYKKEYKEEYK